MMGRLISFSKIALLLFSFTAQANKTDKDYETLAEKIWQDQIQRSPYLASRSGDQQAASQLPDVSIAAITAEFKQVTWFIKQLEALPFEQLNEENQVNYQILKHRLDNIVSNFKYKAYQIPITAEGGFHTSLGFLPSSTKLTSKQDIDNYLSRLSLFKSYFSQQIAHMKTGLKQGNSQPQIVLKGFEHSIDGFIVSDPTQSTFYQPFARSLNFLSDIEQSQVKKRATEVIVQSVIPSYQMFRDFILNEYIPQARTEIGLAATQNGKDYYADRAKHYTTTDLSPAEIHAIGLTEVKRIRQQMQEIIDSTKFTGDFDEFLTFLRTDPQFYPTTAEQLLKEASFIAKKMDAQLPKLFKTLPRTPYGVAPVPDHIAPKYTTGRYVGAATDTDPGYYWVNTYALDRRPLYELEALTLHEAVPGHHLQISLSREMTDVPPYRANYYMSAFGEGWGLYAEWLGKEVGFYQDPYSDFGRLTYEMWRASRLVVDTGMHVMGWSRQQAIDFMKDNTALSLHNITTEVDRYISWPGQALSYKMGEITIKRLRAKAEAELANKFDIREFHHHILKNGSVPLNQLERQVNLYIQQSK